MEASTVVTAIQAQIADLTADATTIIPAAIGLGFMFFGAKYLYKKFKGLL